MRERLQSWLGLGLEKWRGFTKGQKIKIGAISGIIVLALVLTLILTFRTVWVPAFENVDSVSAGVIQDILQDDGIRSRTDLVQGVVYVPASDVTRATIVVHRSPEVHRPGFNFQDAIDASGMGVTSTLQHEMLVAADQTRIEGILVGMGGITNAEVTLVVPHSTMLLVPTTPSSAAVVLTGNNITPDLAETVATIVQRSVRGLSLERIVVADNQGHTLFRDGQRQGSSVGAHTLMASVEQAARITAERQAADILASFFTEIIPAANVRVDWSDIATDTIEHVNSVLDAGDDLGNHRGHISQEDIREVQAIMRPEGGVMEPGLMANDFPGGPLLGEELPAGTMSLFETEIARQFLYDQTRTIVNRNNAGTVMHDASSISLTGVNYVIHTRADLIALEIIEDTDVAWLQFQHDMGERVIITDMDWTEHINHVSMATGIPVANVSIMAQDRNIFVDFPPAAPLPLATIVLLALLFVFIGLLAFGLVRRTAPQPIEDIEPELSVEDLLVSSQLEEARESEIERLQEIHDKQNSAVQEQIDKFVKEKPDAVAQLLRNWINEDWE